MKSDNLYSDLSYAKNLLKRNSVKILTPLDVIHEAITHQGVCKKKMRDFVLTEKRRNKTSIVDVKVCSQCKQEKTANEFYFRVDYRMNYRYHMQPCKECHSLNYHKNK